MDLTPKRYDPDCTGDPASWPFAAPVPIRLETCDQAAHRRHVGVRALHRIAKAHSAPPTMQAHEWDVFAGLAHAARKAPYSAGKGR